MGKGKRRDVEQALKNAGIVFPAVRANKRAKEMRQLLNDMLGFNDKALHFVKGGAL